MLYTLEEFPIGTKVLIDPAKDLWSGLNPDQLPPNLELIVIGKAGGDSLWGKGQDGRAWYIDEERWPIKAYQLQYQCFDCRTDFAGDLHYLCPSCRERVINGRAA